MEEDDGGGGGMMMDRHGERGEKRGSAKDGEVCHPGEGQGGVDETQPPADRFGQAMTPQGQQDARAQNDSGRLEDDQTPRGVQQAACKRVQLLKVADLMGKDRVGQVECVKYRQQDQ